MTRLTMACLLTALMLVTRAIAADSAGCTDTAEPWTTLTRVEGEVTVDGQPQHVRFAGLYDWLTWIVATQDKGKEISWPPTLQAVDFSNATADSGVMASFPLELVELSAEGLELTEESSSPARGPWIVSTEDFIDGAYWPRYLVFTQLQDAGAAAATYHGELYHWDTGLVKILEFVRRMNMPSGGGAGHPFEVMPDAGDEPPAPVIIPSADQDLG